MKTIWKIIAIGVVFTMIAAACAPAPTPTPTEPPATATPEPTAVPTVDPAPYIAAWETSKHSNTYAVELGSRVKTRCPAELHDL